MMNLAMFVIIDPRMETHLEGGHSNIATICNLMVSRNKPMRMCVDDETVM